MSAGYERKLINFWRGGAYPKDQTDFGDPGFHPDQDPDPGILKVF